MVPVQLFGIQASSAAFNDAENSRCDGTVETAAIVTPFLFRQSVSDVKPNVVDEV
jgi:hypothetical protein